MGKKRIGENAVGLEQRVAAPQVECNDCDGDGGAERLAAGTRKSSVEPPPAQAKAHLMPHSHRELGEAILSSGDPVKVGRELLDKSDDRGAATRLRSLETFADWTFGKFGAEGRRQPPRIIWDIPGPPYEPPDPELEKAERGEK